MTLNDYIIESVDSFTDRDFMRGFAGAEVYFPLIGRAAELPVGDRLIGSDDQIKLQLADFDGGVMAVFYTSKSDPRISDKRFAGLPLMEAVSVVCDLPEIDGIILQSDSTAWVIVSKDELLKLVEK
ncbi:MAG: hypothetical protein KF800_11875 [Lysobacter sp.]|nr:hypothetical protein [Lysobacter sp.]